MKQNVENKNCIQEKLVINHLSESSGEKKLSKIMQSSVTFQLNTLATVCHRARRLFLFLSVWAGLLIALVQVKPGKVSYE